VGTEARNFCLVSYDQLECLQAHDWKAAATRVRIRVLPIVCCDNACGKVIAVAARARVLQERHAICALLVISRPAEAVSTLSAVSLMQ
jgi:hypothetical protein